MHTIDVIDETILNHPTDRVWHALVAELNGAANWWTPHNTFQPGPTAPQHKGGTSRITVHPNGVGKPGPKLRFTATTTHVDAERQLTTTLSGHFTGDFSYTLTPVDDGARTRLTITFTSTPHGWPALLDKVAHLGFKHSQQTQRALTQLRAHLDTHLDTHRDDAKGTSA
ncbi:SRPBCC domain-containing protein [Kitasatospora sp. NPDC057904]|uniref:SRPBCC family protein n=1 Tax=unclassified Kitasatospora TaxID=2633591 RepID=UPI0036D95478